MEQKIINLTPHDVLVKRSDGTIRRFLKSGKQARLTTKETTKTGIFGIPVVTKEFSDTENLPPQSEDTFYIVSSMILHANRDRKDLLAPDTGNTCVRDDGGQIVAVTRFIRN